MYIGVTSDLEKRVSQHRHKVMDGFTSKYNVNKLVYYETFRNVKDAICREKQLKGYSRDKKNNLVLTMNPKWIDLYEVH